MQPNSDIHNYYEKLLYEHLTALGLDKEKDQNYLADLSCIALNLLPTRYIRHSVDLMFYMPAQEYFGMQLKVKEAVERARDFLDNND